MQSIDVEQLSKVTGGIAGLLQAAGPILNGVANIIGAAKSGGGQAPPQAAPAAPPTDYDRPSVSVSVRTGAF